MLDIILIFSTVAAVLLTIFAICMAVDYFAYRMYKKQMPVLAGITLLCIFICGYSWALTFKTEPIATYTSDNYDITSIVEQYAGNEKYIIKYIIDDSELCYVTVYKYINNPDRFLIKVVNYGTTKNYYDTEFEKFKIGGD